MLYKYQYPHHFCSVCFEEVCCSYSHHQRTNQFQMEKLWLRNQSDILYHFFLLPEGLFVEVNFPKVLPNLKMAFSIAFSLVSKFASCPVAATDIAGAGFILTITWCWSNSCCSDSWGRGKSDKNIAVSCGYRNRFLIIHKRKSKWHYEFNKLEDQNIKVYLSLLKSTVVVIGYTFVAILKRFTRVGSSKQKVWENSEFPLIREDWRGREKYKSVYFNSVVVLTIKDFCYSAPLQWNYIKINEKLDHLKINGTSPLAHDFSDINPSLTKIWKDKLNSCNLLKLLSCFTDIRKSFWI